MNTAHVLKLALDFHTKEERDKYNKQHPAADKSIQRVLKPKSKSYVVDGDEPSRNKHPEDNMESTKGQSKDSHWSLFKKFISNIPNLPKHIEESLHAAKPSVQKFCMDKEHRDTVLKKAVENIKKSPAKLSRHIYRAAKEEIHELKHAGSAVKKMMKGKKLDKKDKKALFSTAMYVAGATLAAVGGGALVAGGTIGKSFAIHVGTKALHALLDDGYLAFEGVEHSVHGFHHVHHVLNALHLAAVQHVEDISEEDPYESDEGTEASLVSQLIGYTAAEFDKGITDEDMGSILQDTQEPDYDSFEVNPKILPREGTGAPEDDDDEDMGEGDESSEDDVSEGKGHSKKASFKSKTIHRLAVDYMMYRG
jgi:hypothetical protein